MYTYFVALVVFSVATQFVTTYIFRSLLVTHSRSKDPATMTAAKSPFLHPWWEAYSDVGDPAKSKDEWLIIDISNAIRAKPDWETKYKDPEITAKWKAEIRAQSGDKTEHIEEVIAFVFHELEWYDFLQQNFPGFHESGFKVGIDDKIVYSDTAVDEELRGKLREHVETVVEQEFSGNKGGPGLDYHPGSNNQVVDIVHPSLYPLQYGVTPLIKKPKESEGLAYKRKWPSINEPVEIEIAEFDKKIAAVKDRVCDYGVSEKFQWIPAKLRLEKKWQQAPKYVFESYINNLHPAKYEKLYEVIADVFDASLPGLNLTLSRLATSRRGYLRHPIPMYDLFVDEYRKLEQEIYAKGDADDEFDPDEAFDELAEQKHKYFKSFPPQIPKHQPPVNYDFDLKQDFENLKVIVKLANIELTPESSSYKGGSWHVEGTINEDIVATILYYYDSENITESTLSFRGAYEDPMYEQDEHESVAKFYGIKEGDRMVHDLGSVVTSQSRLLVFPNRFQHHVDAFELKDKTKPGHRKILCMFVVDPYNDEVVASDRVPPQQPGWWEDTNESNLSRVGLTKHTKNLIMKAKKKKGWPLTLDEAKGVREALMQERSAPPPSDDEMIAFTRTISLCEH